jgi:membrane associated rhomboid family serine protease
MQSPFGSLSPVVKNLLIINILCFLPSVLFNENINNAIITHFAAFYIYSPFFRPWQIITYMFLHGGWEHIIFNMFALFSFGPIVEYSIGSKRFFTLYFVCGIGAILLQLLVQGVEVYHLVGHFSIPDTLQTDDMALVSQLREIYSSPTLGASGAIFGVLIAFGMLYPNMELMIMFIPVPIKAKYIIPVYILIELTLGIGRFGGDNVAHFAHLGGALIAFILIKIWGLKTPNSFT